MRDKTSRAWILTGGIASGKSTASALFSELGITILDADKISHEKFVESRDEILQVFGDEILQNGDVSRQILGKIVFKNYEKLRALEAILHPKITREILKRAEILEMSRENFFIDMPIFFKINGAQIFRYSKILLVVASVENQRLRLMARNGLSENEAMERINSQCIGENEKKLADFVVKNDESVTNFHKKLRQILKNNDFCLPRCVKL